MDDAMVMVNDTMVYLWLAFMCISAPQAEATPMKSPLSRGISDSGVIMHSYASRLQSALRSASSVHHDVDVRCLSCSPAALFVSSPTKHNASVRGKGYVPSSMPFMPKHLPPFPSPKFIQTGLAVRMSPSSSTSSDATRNENTSKSNVSGVNISIEYCSACRWMLRSSWIASELLTTFANESKLTSVTMVPQSPPLSEGGIFRVCASSGGKEGDGNGKTVVLWDRKVEGRFPESKEVKQLVRDCVNPDKDLGHSDNKQQTDGNDNGSGLNAKETDCIECKEEQKESLTSKQASNMKQQSNGEPKSSPSIPPIFYTQNQVSIEYSTGSSIDSPENALYRATYYSNELLSMIYERNAWWKNKQQKQGDVTVNISVDEENVPAVVDSVTLIPNRQESGMVRVKLNDRNILYGQSTDDDTTIVDGGHLRDVMKEIILGGGDLDANVDSLSSNDSSAVIGLMDEDEAAEARKFFGVF